MTNVYHYDEISSLLFISEYFDTLVLTIRLELGCDKIIGLNFTLCIQLNTINHCDFTNINFTNIKSQLTIQFKK